MNKAQKRTWLCLVISLAGISLGAAAVTLIKIMQLNMANTDHHTTFRLLSLLLTIPLILIVIIGARFPKKIFDERDKLIDRKANAVGIVGAFVFLGAASWFLGVITKMGSIKVVQITLLVYLAAFVWCFISSAAGLIQYGGGGKDGKK
ncbi:MAG: hypothetical protein JSU70_04540 [Phycisphaerales bacterium]|nr:MAG: hypothetical protein JSU70_04540 [Phycisphaerales bacterium]